MTGTAKATVRVLDPGRRSLTPSARGGTWNGDVSGQRATPGDVHLPSREHQRCCLDLGAGVQDDKCAFGQVRQRGRGNGLIQPGQTWVYECDDAGGNHDRDQRGDGDRR